MESLSEVIRVQLGLAPETLAAQRALSFVQPVLIFLIAFVVSALVSRGLSKRQQLAEDEIYKQTET